MALLGYCLVLIIDNVIAKMFSIKDGIYAKKEPSNENKTEPSLSKSVGVEPSTRMETEQMELSP